MKLNVKKLDETIAKLQELRRLATDPNLATFITLTGRPSTNGSSPHKTADNSLKEAVVGACLGLSGNFTIKDVFAAMQKEGTNPKSDSAEKSVGNYLRTLAAEGIIKIAIQGKGRRATAYSNL